MIYYRNRVLYSPLVVFKGVVTPVVQLPIVMDFSLAAKT